MSVNPSTTEAQDLKPLVEALHKRIDSLEERLQDAEDRNDELEQRLETVEQTNDELRQENERLRQTVEGEHDARLNALQARTDTLQESLGELQSRELEKGAHLLWENIEAPHKNGILEVDGDQIERITKDDGRRFARLPDEADPLGDGSIRIAHADLLPVQQLSRLDDDMLDSHTNKLPDALAARVWRELEDDQGLGPWSKGCKDVRFYIDSSDLRTWIIREEGVSQSYAKKLTTRTMNRLRKLSKGRLGEKKRTHRKNGLSYKERRIVFKTGVDIPGFTEDT